MGDRVDEDRPGFAVTALRAAVLDGTVYRVSPAMASAAAIAGHFVDVREW